MGLIDGIVRLAGGDHGAVAGHGVLGQAVFSDAGECCGRIWDVRIDRRSGRILEVLVGVEKLGFLQEFRAMPWRSLRYDPARQAYVARTSPWAAPGPKADRSAPSEADKAWQVRMAIAHSPFLTLPFL